MNRILIFGLVFAANWFAMCGIALFFVAAMPQHIVAAAGDPSVSTGALVCSARFTMIFGRCVSAETGIVLVVLGLVPILAIGAFRLIVGSKGARGKA